MAVGIERVTVYLLEGGKGLNLVAVDGVSEDQLAELDTKRLIRMSIKWYPSTILTQVIEDSPLSKDFRVKLLLEEMDSYANGSEASPLDLLHVVNDIGDIQVLSHQWDIISYAESITCIFEDFLRQLILKHSLGDLVIISTDSWLHWLTVELVCLSSQVPYCIIWVERLYGAIANCIDDEGELDAVLSRGQILGVDNLRHIVVVILLGNCNNGKIPAI